MKKLSITIFYSSATILPPSRMLQLALFTIDINVQHWAVPSQ
jgi:hypothetical protein